MQSDARKYMTQALDMAKQAANQGEIPVGAVIVNPMDGKIIAKACNQTENLNDPAAHAEIIAIKIACQSLKTPRINGYDLYVTLEPCTMCAAVISFARIRRVIFGAYDIKGGGVEHGACFYNQPTCHHKPEVIGGFMESQCGAVLKDFFKNKR